MIELFDLHYTKAMEIKEELSRMLSAASITTEIKLEQESDDEVNNEWLEVAEEKLVKREKEELKPTLRSKRTVKIEAKVKPVEKTRRKPGRKRLTEKKFFQCDYCMKKKRCKFDLKEHMSTHISEMAFKCPTCNKRSSSAGNLKIHQRSHGKRARLQCDLCELSLLDRRGFRRHYLKYHTTQRDFLCSKCPKTFATLTCLQLHSITHKVEKKHGCPLCTSRFHDTYKLNRHIRTHGPKEGVSCTICTFRCREKYHLNAHMRRIHSDGVFKEQRKILFCTLCDKKFDRKNKLREHLSKIHEVVSESENGTAVDDSKI